MNKKQTTKEERLRQFDELVYSGSHGVKGVGWPTKTWGMITSFSKIHELFEEIMHRPVWTHEMAYPQLLREELEYNMEPLNPIDSLRRISPHAKIIGTVVPDKEKES